MTIHTSTFTYKRSPSQHSILLVITLTHLHRPRNHRAKLWRITRQRLSQGQTRREKARKGKRLGDIIGNSLEDAAMAARLQCIYVDGVERQKLVHVHVLGLPKAHGTSDCLRHLRFVRLLSLGEVGRDEYDVVGACEVAIEFD